MWDPYYSSTDDLPSGVVSTPFSEGVAINADLLYVNKQYPYSLYNLSDENFVLDHGIWNKDVRSGRIDVLFLVQSGQDQLWTLSV